MLEREITKKLIEWKKEKDKKALLITGARQIGKTFSIREFGKTHYKNFLEINFIESAGAEEIFENVSNVDMIVTNLTAYAGKSLPPGETLIFLDEIQECPAARTAIKFLVDDGRYDYIESGSLLGVNYKAVPSYPVGYEKVIRMYPITLAEFFTANGVADTVIAYLRECWEQNKAVSKSVHETMCRLFRYYMVVGGMPAAVQSFVDTHDIGRVVEIQQDILELYRQDIAKYSLNDKMRIKEIFDRIPAELNEKNKRFIIADIKKSARMERYENSFLWLKDAGVALPCMNITEPKAPLMLNEKHNLFKLFLADTGLLCAASLENVQFEILQNRLDVNRGSILENAYAQMFAAAGFTLRYFDKKNKGELDFVLQKGKEILPVEIKSGHNYKIHPTLNYVLDVEDWKLKKGIVFCQGNMETEGKICYYPWYMAMFLVQDAIGSGMTVNVDLTGLHLPEVK